MISAAGGGNDGGGDGSWRCVQAMLDRRRETGGDAL